MAGIDYEGNRKYFREVSYKPSIILIAIAVFMFGTGDTDLTIVGLALAGTGAYLIYRQVDGRSSDADIDRQFNSIPSGLRERALGKLGLDEEEVKLIDPIVVAGRSFDSLGTPVMARRGKDGLLRSSNNKAIVIFFTEQELHAYTYVISLVTENERRQSTEVYFYRDVVSVETGTTSVPVTIIGDNLITRLFGPKKQGAAKVEMFRLTTSGGTTIDCSVDTFDDIVGRNIQAARQLIRSKKMHEV